MTMAFQADPLASPLMHDNLHAVLQTKFKLGITQKDWKPFPPIPFTVQGREGINLVDALNRHWAGLDGRDDAVFTQDGVGNSIALRMKVRSHYYTVFH